MEIPLTIKETQEGLIKKKFSAVQLVDAYLARIEKFDKDINSFLTLSEEMAYLQAKEVDKKIEELGEAAFDKNPLLGVVVAHKDLFLTKGLRTTAASKVLENFVPVYSATVVKRLEDAGAITLGKTNCDAWAHGASGENSDFGSTKNPWQKEYVPGGSSSGSAAAISAQFSLIATGTDTGGSIRQPANFCGIVGFKPTYGVVPRYGVIAMASSLDSVGHFGMTVDDVEKVFEVTKGEDERDSTVKNIRSNKSNSKIKIGIPKEYFIKGLDSEVEKSVKEAADIFKSQGIELVNISLPHTKYAISVYYIVQPAEVSSNLGRYDGIRYGKNRDSFGDEAKRRIMLGTYVLSAGYYDAYYLKAQKVRSKIIEDFEDAFNKVDAIIAPVSPTPAFKLGEKAEDPLQMYLADVLTAAANVAGIPGLAIPSGFSSKGLPLGFQLMGARFSEPTLFKLGKLYQRTVGWKPKIAFQ
ncbi:Asp-tRNA(Asn)/Glu-tRNA(Gln) amidotransferase subunit GatA [Patescibacteria group bacterium]|nr:Asp-tRNA(Asn)/Glu-tRNA(Gln) amidotransferase subunit GatA [Patescibacteria group bacterium]MBU0777284.1 Asp-tRNA(Asn)/Glu-tRNA(Gln) amidotransferase subunit GatA [Patescibacteria group bacterium]MBU0845730.1 Asp-tRNA(Asn)/Glu-tRNA(Gln) amidotransferase subunit GatA [Patescibacteria group bacterium]MBU0923039.1 Asp-tRNA(Asn)/Glu-tRNA(Gln) amidotransferase subunit GatA [Patescibacteria group bacterium]MBU1066590.1 Asp-tRNA(Asn)/Glu-tRNA(Gln) amidotransferase subunit GatA [Patescibacteria group